MNGSKALTERAGLLDHLLEASCDIILITSLDGRIELASAASLPILGYQPEELAQRGLRELLHPDEVAGSLENSRRLHQGERVQGARERWRRKDGSYVWVESSATPKMGDGVVYCVVREITQVMQAEARLEWQAFHDPLTGLHNRIWFMEHLERQFAEPTSDGQGLLFLDLDNFKRVNDSLGHEAGDDLLASLSTRLIESTKETGIPVRLGGDEFALLLCPRATEQDAICAAERVTQALSAPFLLNGHEVFVTFSIGIAMRRAEHLEPADLLRDADIAHYWAKNHGKACYALFEPWMNRRALERLRLEGELRRALRRAEFRVHYQPIVDLQSGQVDGIEALVRWQHPSRGLVAPGEFIALAEETGLILEIGAWVLNESCRQLKRWQALHPRSSPLFVSVNISPRQVQEPGLVDLVAQALAEHGIQPRALKLEITEGVVMNDEALVVENLQALREMGVRLAIDDFGTGYSALGYLRRFTVETLKIARPFIDGLDQDAEATEIVRAIVALAKSLNIEVTAEGVERSHQLEALRALGCDRVQGYYLARPMPPEAVTELLGLRLPK